MCEAHINEAVRNAFQVKNMKKSLNSMLPRVLAGFAAGIMMAASLWSLLISAMEQSQSMDRILEEKYFNPRTVLFVAGFTVMIALDVVLR